MPAVLIAVIAVLVSRKCSSATRNAFSPSGAAITWSWGSPRPSGSSAYGLVMAAFPPTGFRRSPPTTRSNSPRSSRRDQRLLAAHHPLDLGVEGLGEGVHQVDFRTVRCGLTEHSPGRVGEAATEAGAIGAESRACRPDRREWRARSPR